MEAGQRNELELESHCTQLFLELGDRRIVEVLLPVERRGAVVGEQLIGELRLDTLGELSCQFQIRGAGLHPDEVGVGGVGLGPGDARRQTVVDPIEALRSALAGDEGAVALVDVRGDQGRRLGVGAGDHDCRHVGHVSGQPGGGQCADVLLGRDEHLATEVSALLLRRQLVLPVRTGHTGGDHRLLKFVDVERAAEARLAVGDDGHQPVVDGRVALDLGDLVGAQQCVVDPANHLGHRVGGVEALVGVGVPGQVGVTGDLPAGEVDRLESAADLLNRHVAGERTQCVDELHVVELLPQHLRAAAGQRLLLDHAALQGDDVGRGVGAVDARPARVGVPVALDFFGALGPTDGGNRHDALLRVIAGTSLTWMRPPPSPALAGVPTSTLPQREFAGQTAALAVATGR